MHLASRKLKIAIQQLIKEEFGGGGGGGPLPTFIGGAMQVWIFRDFPPQI